MPTTKNRYPITETEEVAAALAAAAKRWPEEGDNPTRLLNRLITEGRHSIETEAEQRRQRRIAAIDRTAGALTGVFGADALEELRQDWPG